MTIQRLVESINTQLGGELLSIGELRDFIDKAIDDINTRLNTKFPVLSDVIAESKTEYTAIPDKYMRSVVVPGTAFKYYTTDEEGAAVSPKYEEEYLKGLFYMERDYIAKVPEEYLEDDIQGTLEDPLYGIDPYTMQRQEGALTIDGSVFQL